MDAEHVVILMQENRSFDHCFGTLQGVRGYNDPRAITQPNGNKVWLQSGKEGQTYAPFRFDINDTKITWMGSIPHTRHSQIDAWNHGKHDGWIDAKHSGHHKYAPLPLTMGHYSREDLPFNYAMADAFTICDHNFCSLLGPTRPNRLFLFTGTNRSEKSGDARPILENEGVYHWKTMPEWLEENDVSWRIYQNDISKGGGLTEEQRRWLANLGASTNTMEVFSQYNVEFYPRYVESLKNQVAMLPGEIKALEKKLESRVAGSDEYKKTKQAIDKKKEVLDDAREGVLKWSPEAFAKLTQTQKNLFNKAFTTNAGDPDYRSLTELTYDHNGKELTLQVPKGDMFYQFRKDVENGQLPTVSWLIPSARFSDHPAQPWYGSWFTSEILDILTKNPETWKKTIFILTYDENDGYFDHIPPFTAPDPADKKTGRCSAGVNVSGAEYTYKEKRIRDGIREKAARGGPIGLGFRVPMIVASPWSRGGRVCSQVFDQTSILQFLEHFINRKYGKQLQVTNLSNWRRTVCGDLTSVFREYKEGGSHQINFLDRDGYVKKIYGAQFKELPSNYKDLSEKEIREINENPESSSFMPQQEPGIRPSCGLPYELYADGQLSEDKKALELTMKAGNKVFGSRSTGSPFKVYARGEYVSLAAEEKNEPAYEKMRVWDYAITAGDEIAEAFPLSHFKENEYHLCVYGPNGFFREMKGRADDPALHINCRYEPGKPARNKLTGNILLQIRNGGSEEQHIRIIDHNSSNRASMKAVPANGQEEIVLNLTRSRRWYDFTVEAEGRNTFMRRYAGRVENGEEGVSDPAMGRTV
jgi:phospholipase C